MSLRTRKYEEMLPHEFFSELDRKPVAWMPCGLLEWHGKQNALGLDGLKVYEMCLRAADQAGGIVMPTLWVGPGGRYPCKDRSEWRESLKKPMLGNIWFDRDLCATIFADTFTWLERIGFKAVVALGGHYPSGDMLRNVAAEYSGNLNIWADKDPVLIKEEGGGGDHGGKWETSYLWALRPELVDFSQTDGTCGGRMDRDGAFGVSHNFEEASPEFGRKWVTLAVNKLVKIAENLLK